MKLFIYTFIFIFFLSACSAPKRLTKPDRIIKGNFEKLSFLIDEQHFSHGIIIESSQHDSITFVRELKIKADSIFFKKDLHGSEYQLSQSIVSEIILFESYPYGEAAGIGFKRSALITSIIFAGALEFSNPSTKDRLIGYPTTALLSFIVGSFGGLAMMETGFSNRSQKKITFIITN